VSTEGDEIVISHYVRDENGHLVLQGEQRVSNAPVVQLEGHQTTNLAYVGSSPTGCTKFVVDK
jgi:hypothetical protein